MASQTVERCQPHAAQFNGSKFAYRKHFVSENNVHRVTNSHDHLNVQQTLSLVYIYIQQTDIITCKYTQLLVSFVIQQKNKLLVCLVLNHLNQQSDLAGKSNARIIYGRGKTNNKKAHTHTLKTLKLLSSTNAVKEKSYSMSNCLSRLKKTKKNMPINKQSLVEKCIVNRANFSPPNFRSLTGGQQQEKELGCW